LPDEDDGEGALVTFGAHIAIGNEAVEELPSAFAVSVSLESVLNYLDVDFNLNSVNTHRIAAFDDDGNLVGGTFDQATRLFNFEATNSGYFTIAYDESLRRLNLSLQTLRLTDLAGNVDAFTVDMAPVIHTTVTGYQRMMMPVSFLMDAMGAAISWTPATVAHPIIIHVYIGEEVLYIPIGAIPPNLAGLGLDTPAQIQDNRTLLPLNFTAEYFGSLVDWDVQGQTVSIIQTNR